MPLLFGNTGIIFLRIGMNFFKSRKVSEKEKTKCDVFNSNSDIFY